MKYWFLFHLIIFTWLIPTGIRAQSIFHKVYITTAVNSTMGKSVLKLQNNNYLLLGEGQGKIILLNADSLGVPIDARLITSDTLQTISSLTLSKTDDGNYLITSTAEIASGFPSSYGAACIIKWNNGGAVWAHIVVDTSYYLQFWYKKTISFNNSYYSVGESYVNSNFTSNSDTSRLGLFSKLDENGNLLWSYHYGKHSTTFNDFIISPDGSFIIAGREETFDSTGSDQSLIYLKTDSFGNVLWSYRLDVPFGAQLYSVLDDGSGYLFGGACNFNGLDGDAFIFKTNYTGEIIWSKKYGNTTTGSDEIKLMVRTSRGNIIVSSGFQQYIILDSIGNDPIFHSISISPGFINQLLINSADGVSGVGTTGPVISIFQTDSIFQSCINNNGPYPYASVNLLSDTNICDINALPMNCIPVSFSDSLVNYSDSLICETSTGVNEINLSESWIVIYPNPFSNDFLIRSEKFIGTEVIVKVYDVTGRLIYSDKSIGLSEFQINTAGISRGMYFIKLNFLNYCIVRTIIKS
jgi:hypothetical protein